MTHLPSEPDCLVIGSGPAGVSAALALVERGARVVLLDAGRQDRDIKNESNLASKFLGDKLEALLPEDGLSPKLRTPEARRMMEEFVSRTNIRGDRFIAVGALACGGLSRIWGGLVCEFDDDDIRDWPITADELRPSYKTVVERVGVSGSDADDMAGFFGHSGRILPPLTLGSLAKRVLTKYNFGKPEPQFALGLARNAILTVDRNNRLACDLRKDCLWGCERGAVYDARFDLIALERHPRFDLVEEALVIRLAPTSSGWAAHTDDGRTFEAPRIVLAAGALNTAKLVIPLLANPPSELRLLNNPVAAIPLLLPAGLANPHSAHGYSLAQLGYRFRFGNNPTDYVTGAVYEIDGLPSASFTARLPFSRRAGAAFFDFFAPGVLASTCYFPGTYSDNSLRCSRQGNEVSLVVRGGSVSGLASTFTVVRRNLRRIWRRLGVFMLPSTSFATPGTDVHYAGLFAMGHMANVGTTKWGELNSAPGIYIADGAVVPSLPSKHLTLTIMANADRIGRHLAHRIRG